MFAFAQLFASPRLTVAVFLLLAMAALGVAHGHGTATVLMTAPIVLLLLNLSAAIAVNPRIRGDLPLLLFHLALLGLIVLIVFARQTYFDGGIRLNAGDTFAGDYVSIDQGDWHGAGAQSLRFANEGLIEFIPPGNIYPKTINRILWWDNAGRPHATEIGDDRPLVMNGYRIYTTRQRGFAPIFLWQKPAAPDQFGTFQINNSFLETGTRDFPDGTTVTLPNGKAAWMQLVPLVDPVFQGEQENLGAATLDHHVVLRIDQSRFEVRPGDSVALPDGRLTYVRLETWMGYRVTYDPATPWLATTALLAVVSLFWFYLRQWNRPSRKDHAEGDTLVKSA